MSAAALKQLTVAEFLAQEELAEFKSEYYCGHTYAMAGASFAHSQIIHRFHFLFGRAFTDHDCQVIGSDAMVETRSTYHAYPDLLIVCEPPQFSDTKTRVLTNPNAIIEVLSPSTESFDRGDKFQHYRSIPTLRDYILVSQNKPLIEHFVKQPDGKWLMAEYAGLEAILELTNYQVKLPLAEIYRDVEFPPLETIIKRLHPEE